MSRSHLDRGRDVRVRAGDGTSRAAFLASVVRRVPFTAGATATVLLLGVVTGSLWDSLGDRQLLHTVGYGLPAFQDSQWWTPLTGAFFGLTPATYVSFVGAFVMLVGFAEWRLATRRTLGVTVVVQVCAVLVSALFLSASAGHGWAWADETSRTVDVGFSAGALGAAAAASATLSAPWRARVRIALMSYCLIAVMYVGALWDVEHAVGVALGLAAGPALLGRRIRTRLKLPSRYETRLLAACLFVYSAFASWLGSPAGSGGPLTSGEDGSSYPTQGLLAVACWLLIAVGLRAGSRLAWRCAVVLTSLLLTALAVFAVVLFVSHQSGWPLTIFTMIITSIQLALLLVGGRAFRNPTRRRARRTSGHPLFQPGTDVRERSTRRLREVGTPNHLAWMTTWPENRWFLPGASEGGYIAYQSHAGVAIGLCDPIGATPEDRHRLMEDFAAFMTGAGLLPALFSVTQEAADHAAEMGWQALQVAEEAVLSLPELEYRGRAWQDVRTALNQAAKLGITHQLITLKDAPRGVQMQVRAMSERWMDEADLPEMGFTLGGIDEAMDPAVRVSLATDADGTVQGLTSWMPVYGPHGAPVGWTLDVMRRLPGGFRHTMEFLIASACMSFKEEGAQIVSLSGVPLATAGRDDSTTERGGLDGFLDVLGSALEPYYGFRSLQAFKSKFQPQYNPLYLVFPDEAALPRIGLALTRAYLPNARLRELVALARAGH